MPKMKSNRAMKLRFKLTGTGKLMRRKHGRKHILTKKSSKRKRSLGREAAVQTTHLKKYKRLMCVG